MADRKRQKVDILPQLNSRYFQKEFQHPFRSAFTEKRDFRDQTTNAGTTERPFPSGVLRNVLDKPFLKQVRSAVLEETFFHKSNDLYEFYQSEELRLSKNSHLIALRETIYSDRFVELLSNLTGIQLNTTVDLSAHRYPDKGFLLCHDDDIGNATEGRRIAFILYLVEEDWSGNDGGTLDLFDKDENNQATDIVYSIIPEFNSLAFFEVGSTSFHQVSEIVGGRERVSISGWFHGPFPQRKSIVQRPLQSFDNNTQYELADWINGSYQSLSARAAIQDAFVDQSSVQLQTFLREDVFLRLLESLGSVSWESLVGPATVRRYQRAKKCSENEEKPFWIKVHDFFASTVFSRFLTSVTGLECAQVFTEERKFTSGDYTLLHDLALEPDGLDVIFSCIDLEWENSWGGITHYVSGADDLLAISPQRNTLNLVYRTNPTNRFVKYVNHTAKADRTEFSLICSVKDEDEE